MNSIPTVTKNLLIINVLCFFGGVVAMKYGINLNDLLGLHFFMASDFNPAQLITYMFMHAGVLHLLFNMLWLYWFGQLFLFFFLGQAFPWGVYLRWVLWRFALYAGLQCISIFQ